MKILWLTNVPLPQIARAMGRTGPVLGGWLAGYADMLLGMPSVKLTVLCPADRTAAGCVENLRYQTFRSDGAEAVFRRVLGQMQPDIIHVFGTEFAHSARMLQVACDLGLEERTVISLQGLISRIALHYCDGVPPCVQRMQTLRDVLRGTSIRRAAQSFARRGEDEVRALRMARNVIGRTDWDRAVATKLNPEIEYYFCNESLRQEFYGPQWDVQHCERHSLFVSQCSYPIKGFHLMLEAMALLVKAYPDAHLYTTGASPLTASPVAYLRQGSYQRWLGRLIRRHGLENNVTFLGSLDAAAMCRQYLRAHVFVSPSSIENSPNSVGEAMLLGVPVISSDVGGVRSMLRHGEEGFLYPADAPEKIAEYAQKIFEDDALAQTLSQQARAHAADTHDRAKNSAALVEIYETLAKSEIL